MTMNTLEMIARLKEYESLSYRVAYYMLGQKDAAVTVTQNALLELGKDHRFYDMSDQEQRAWAKKVTIKHALRCYADSLDCRKVEEEKAGR